MDIQWLLNQSAASGKSTPAALALRAGDQFTAAVLDVENRTDALLAIGQFKAYARLPLPVVSGQDIQIRVEAIDQGVRMLMLPKNGPKNKSLGDQRLEIRRFEPLSDKPALAYHSRSLVPGQLLHGRITGFEKDGLMLVDFGKFKAFAKIDIPVRPGQTLALTVVRADAGIAFSVASSAKSVQSPGADRLHRSITAAVSTLAPPDARPLTAPVTPTVSVPPTTADMAVLRDHLQRLFPRLDRWQQGPFIPLSPSIKETLTNLIATLDPASPIGDTARLASRVQDFVNHSGLYFEKHLAETVNALQAPSATMTTAVLAAQPAIRELMAKDIKPNLLIINKILDSDFHNLKAADRHLLETVKSMVQRAVSHIDQQQLAATQKPADPDIFQAFSHLLHLTDTPHNARLKVYHTQKGSDEDHRQPRVSLLLDMDRMGTVRTDLWMVGKDLNVTFFVKTVHFKSAIDAERHRLEAMLKHTFNSVAVSVVVNEKKIAQFDGEDLTMPTRRQVDVSI